jgi:hypothetical protein
MPAAFSGRGRDDESNRRRQEDAAYRMEVQRRKLAELEAKEAAKRVDVNDEKAFPSLGGSKAKGKPTAAPPPTPTLAAAAAAAQPSAASWATKMKAWQEEDAIRQREEEEQAARRNEEEAYTRLNSLSLSDNYARPPTYITRSRIIEEQERYDYNKEYHRADELLEEDDYEASAAGRAYSPHSPPYSPTPYDDEDEH